MRVLVLLMMVLLVPSSLESCKGKGSIDVGHYGGRPRRRSITELGRVDREDLIDLEKIKAFYASQTFTVVNLLVNKIFIFKRKSTEWGDLVRQVGEVSPADSLSVLMEDGASSYELRMAGNAYPVGRSYGGHTIDVNRAWIARMESN